MDKNITPEQQEQFKLAAKQAIDFLTSGKAPEMIIRKARMLGPEKAATEAIVPLLQAIHAASAKAGRPVATEVLVAVGMHCLRVIAELLVMEGILKDNQVQQFATNVTQQAIRMHNAQVGAAP